MDYKNKYFKYKNKYINLKKKMAGSLNKPSLRRHVSIPNPEQYLDYLVKFNKHSKLIEKYLDEKNIFLNTNENMNDIYLIKVIDKIFLKLSFHNFKDEKKNHIHLAIYTEKDDPNARQQWKHFLKKIKNTGQTGFSSGRMISHKKRIYDRKAYLKLIFKKKEDSIDTLIFDLYLLNKNDFNNESFIENKQSVNDFIDEINNSFKLAIKETVIYNFKNSEDFRKSLNNLKKTNFKLNISNSLKLLLVLPFDVANLSNINSERLNDEIFELWKYSIYQQFIKFDLDVIKQEEPKKVIEQKKSKKEKNDENNNLKKSDSPKLFRNKKWNPEVKKLTNIIINLKKQLANLRKKKKKQHEKKKLNSDIQAYTIDILLLNYKNILEKYYDTYDTLTLYNNVIDKLKDPKLSYQQKKKLIRNEIEIVKSKIEEDEEKNDEKK